MKWYETYEEWIVYVGVWYCAECTHTLCVGFTMHPTTCQLEQCIHNGLQLKLHPVGEKKTYSSILLNSIKLMYLKQDFPWPCHFTSVPFAASKSHRWWPAVAKIGSLGLSVPHSNLWFRKAFCQFKLPQFGGKSQRLDKACWRASIEHGCSVIMLDCTCPFSPKCSMFSTWFCPNAGGYQNLWRWRKGPSEPWDCWGYEQFVLVMCLFRACSIHIFLILPSLSYFAKFVGWIQKPFFQLILLTT